MSSMFHNMNTRFMGSVMPPNQHMLVYILCEGSDIKVQLVCSKYRVVPIKKVSLPRLELYAALLLSRLIHKVISTFQNNFTKCGL